MITINEFSLYFFPVVSYTLGRNGLKIQLRNEVIKLNKTTDMKLDEFLLELKNHNLTHSIKTEIMIVKDWEGKMRQM